MPHDRGVAAGDSTESVPSPRALVANDQEIWIWSLETILGPHGFSVSRATTASQVVEQVKAGAPDVLILHATLRDSSGIELCRYLREHQLVSPSTPIIITTTGPCRRHDRLRVLRSGGWDYSSLPLDAEELVAKLRTFHGAKQSSDRASAESMIDPVSGLYDIQGILKRVSELGLAARRHARALGCATVSCGDISPRPEVLAGEVQMATPEMDPISRAPEILRSVVRGSDILGRLGQNEFVILAPETEMPGLMQLAGRLVGAFEAESLVVGRSFPIQVGCYAVADFASIHIEPVELIVRATQALRAAQLPDASPVQLFQNG